MRWGLIGASDIAATRLIPAIHATGGTVSAVSSGDPAHGAQYAQRNAIPVAAASLDELLDRDDVEAVYISSRNEKHAEQALASIAAGKHVLCEKPLTLTPLDAWAVVAAANAAGTVFAVNHHLPGAATHRAIQRLVAEGAIGKPLAASVAHAVLLPERLRGWRLGADPGSGVILDITCHDASALNAILRVPAVSATASAVAQGGWSAGSADAVMSVIRYDGDVLAQTHDAFTIGYRPTALEVHGTEGSVLATDVMTQDPRGTVTLRTATGERTVEVGERRDLYVTILDAFADCAAGKGEPTATAADGANALAVALAVHSSVRTGRVAPVENWFTGAEAPAAGPSPAKAPRA